MYRRRNYGRRRTIRRRYVRRSSYRTRGIKRIVNRVMWRNAETKFRVIDSVNTNIIQPYTGELSWFNGLAQGTGPDNRVGLKIHAKSLQFKYRMNVVFAVGGVLSADIRVLVLYPRKGVDTSTLTTYLTNLVPGPYLRPDPTLFYVLFDQLKTIQPPNNNVAGGNSSSVWFKMYKRAKYIMNYQNDNSVDREPIIYIVSNVPAANATSVLMNGYRSMSFKDF